MARPCKLQINDSGSWRNLVALDLDTAPHHGQAACDAAAEMVLQANPRSRARLRLAVADSQATPLMHWTAAGGWKVEGFDENQG